MVLFNYQRREITGKIVYYGPGLCGKTSNLQYIHDHVDPSDRGKMVSLSTDADRTLFFDFMPVDAGYIKGMKVKFQFYTVPGQVHYNETRKMVLRGADAVVFVADSQRSLIDSNLYSYENMLENLAENGLDPLTIPLVLQYNKRDLPDILSFDELNYKINSRDVKWFEAVAIKGEGVMETFQEIGRLLLLDIAAKYKVEVMSTKDKIEEDKSKKTTKKGDPAKEEPATEKPTPVMEAPAALTGPDDPLEQHYSMVNEFVFDMTEDGELDLTRHIPPETEVVFHPQKDALAPADVISPTKKQAKPDARQTAQSHKLSGASLKDLEKQMDLKIVLQRLKKIMEDSFAIMEKQTDIARQIDDIRDELKKYLR